jgi:DNA-binding FadR family transcriptional regulator
MESAVDNHVLEDLMLADTEFHTVLLRASGNKMLEQLHDTVSVALRAHAENLFTTDRVRRSAIELHRRVAEAIAAEDPDDAELATRTLMEQTAEEIEQIIKQRPGRPR